MADDNNNDSLLVSLEPATIPYWKQTLEGRLPPDSLLQIWARLPLKTLFVCRSVCKLWNISISSDPLLPSLNPNPNPNSPNLLLFLHFPNTPLRVSDRPVLISPIPLETIVSQQPTPDPRPYPIKNGFTPHSDRSLDLLPSKGPVKCFVSNEFFYLANLSTPEFLRISRADSYAAGFGYLDSDNTYVLTRIFDSGQCEILKFGPGSAGSASWREINSIAQFRVRGFGVMLDGVFYWTIDHGKVPSGSTRDEFLLCFDMKSEKFEVVPPPVGNEDEVILYDHLYLVEFKGSLCAIDNKSRPSRMEIWILTRTELGLFVWVRKYNIFISGMDLDRVYPFCDFEGSNGGEMVLSNGDRSRLYCYNLKSRSIRQVYKAKNWTVNRLAVYNPGPFPLNS